MLPREFRALGRDGSNARDSEGYSRRDGCARDDDPRSQSRWLE